MRLLLVEDNFKLADTVTAALTADGFAVDVAGTLSDARDSIASADYDLVLLDLSLPDGDGLTLLRELRRQKSSVPILVVTARGGLGDRIEGLDLGADDYLVKPFAAAELAARCRALLRRPGGHLGAILELGNIAFNVAARDVQVSGLHIDVPPREMQVLEHLLRRQNQVVPKSALEGAIYASSSEVTPNAVEVAVSRLRKRLASAAASVELHTVHGIGYTLMLLPKDAS